MIKFIKIYCLLIFLLPIATLAEGLDRIFYISREGYLAEFDLEQITEIGRMPAGNMPHAICSCSDMIYFTDFASDKVYSYDPISKELKDLEVYENVFDQVIVHQKPDPKDAYSPLRRAVEGFLEKRNIVESTDEEDQSKITPLPAQEHNKKLGLSNIACNNQYLFVASTLKNQVFVIDRFTLEMRESLITGPRPHGLSVSPDQNSLAITSIALNKLFVIDLNSGFEKRYEVDLPNAPTEVEWLDRNRLVVFSRGENSLNLVTVGDEEYIPGPSFEYAISEIDYDRESGRLYALSGEGLKLYIAEGDDLSFSAYDLDPNMAFPNLLMPLDNERVLVNSSIDGKILIKDFKDEDSEGLRVLMNLSPRGFVRLNN